MKIAGQTPVADYSETVVLERPYGPALSLRISPLPLGFSRRLRSRGLTPPQPPVKPLRDSQGRLLRDAAGQPATSRDDADPEYLDALEQYHQRVAVLAIADALRDDSHVSFEARRPAPEGPADGRDRAARTAAWEQYADALFAELEAAGLTPGELLQLCTHVCRVSRLLDGPLQTAQENFSCQRPRPET